VVLGVKTPLDHLASEMLSVSAVSVAVHPTRLARRVGRIGLRHLLVHDTHAIVKVLD